MRSFADSSANDACVGDEDDHIPLENAFKLRDAIPKARLIVFRNCGHLPPAESPEKFVEAVADFCK